MRSKEYLQQIRKLDFLIKNKLAEIESLRDLSTSITSSIKSDAVQSSGEKSKTANAINKIIDLERSINSDVERLTELKKEIMSVIDQIDNADLINVLYKRYFQYKKWDEIAAEMNYTYRHITRLHGQALLKLSEVMNNHETNFKNV